MLAACECQPFVGTGLKYLGVIHDVHQIKLLHCVSMDLDKQKWGKKRILFLMRLIFTIEKQQQTDKVSRIKLSKLIHSIVSYPFSTWLFLPINLLNGLNHSVFPSCRQWLTQKRLGKILNGCHFQTLEISGSKSFNVSNTIGCHFSLNYGT